MLSFERFSLFLTVFLLPLLSACTASQNITETQTHLRNVEDFRTVDVEAISSYLEAYRKTEEDEVLYRLENGMLNYYRGNRDESAQHFQAADAAIERHYTKDISKNLQSLLVNDLQLPYSGEPYEGIYLKTFNCLNYLHEGNMQGALVEMRGINHKLELLNDRYRGVAASLMERDTAQATVDQVDEELEGVDLLTEDDSPPEIQQNSALGRFLTTILYGKTGAQDDAYIELQKLRTALADQGQTEYLSTLDRIGKADRSPSMSGSSTRAQDAWATSSVLPRLFEVPYAASKRDGQHSSAAENPSSTAVSVPPPSQLTQPDAFNTLLISFTGQAPKKEEHSFHLPIVVNDETVQLHFSVPVLVAPPSRVARVRAITAGDTLQVPTIENLQAVAQEMFDQRKPILYTRAVIRAVLKAGATEGAESIAEEKLGDAGGTIAGTLGNAMSARAAQADTRGWQTMPGYAHAVVAKLPEGEHEVTFEFLSDQGIVMKRRTHEVTVQGDEDLALAESVYLK